MPHSVGDSVEAAATIREPLLEGGYTLHARKGDRGEVVGLSDLRGYYVVRWERYGTATDCAAEELRQVQPSAQQYA